MPCCAMKWNAVPSASAVAPAFTELAFQKVSAELTALFAETRPEAIEDLRQAVREAEPGLAETVKWGNLVFVLEGLPVLGLAPVKGHVNLQLLQGAPWPSGLVGTEGAGKGARHWRFDVGAVVDAVLVEQLVSSATRHGRRLLEDRPALDFIEVHSENFFADGGISLAVLDAGREAYAVSLHGVGLALGSAAGGRRRGG